MSCINAGSQRGSSLIEAMIAALLVAIVFVGLTFVLTRTLVGHRYMNAHNAALLEIREKIETQGMNDLCTNGTEQFIVGSQNVAIAATNCTSPAITVAISSDLSVVLAAGSVPAVTATFSTTANSDSAGLFGGDGVVSFSY
jgi:Tfp pilus assembly protein PilW